MAINPSTQYPGQSAAPSAGYPLGSAQNVTVSGDGTGTPLEKTWLNDFWGYFQAKLARVGIVATGTPDQVGASQYLDAEDTRLGGITTNLMIRPYQVTEIADSLRTLDISTENTAAGGVEWSVDGTRFYSANTNGAGVLVASIDEYVCSRAYDLSSAVLNFSLDVSAENVNPESVRFRPDGTDMFVLGSSGNDTIYRYALTTPWDLSTASFASDSLDVSAQISTGADFNFSPDGSRLVILNSAIDTAFQYSPGTAWDISTYSYDSVSSTVSPPSTSITAFVFNGDGTESWWADFTNGSLVRYSHATPYVLTGWTKVDETSIPSTVVASSIAGMAVDSRGNTLLLAGSNEILYQLSVATVNAL
jgi:hypothetical protein